jgi:CubicO group peptidase (beta-lactamase class C family)
MTKNSLFRISLSMLLIIPLLVSAQEKKLKKTLKELDKYYEKALSDWEVPGMAVAIVKDDSVVFAEGYGLLDINGTEEVDANSMFAIASNTKAYTSAALALLVDEGKINWDDRVQEYIPWFQLYDPYVSANMTIRDLLTHRSGLKTFAGDLLWYGSDYDRNEVIRRARYLEPTYDFRTKFGYSNIMYLTAGQIVEAVTDTTWDDFLRHRFFESLGMERTITTTNELDKFTNVAQPHTEFEEETITIPYLNWDNIAPAGSIISSVNDVAQWIRLQLNNGVYQKDTIFSKKVQREMWSPVTTLHISAGAERLWPSTHLKGYALGWQVYDYLGKKIVTHNGGYDGMISQTVLIPELNMGFVILTNKNASLYYPLQYKTMDMLIGGNDTDWSEMFLKFQNARGKKEEETPKEEAIPASLPLEDYCGTYGGAIYGNAEVSLKEGKLFIDLLPTQGFESTLEHFNCNTFRIRMEGFPSLPGGTVNFLINEKGEASELLIDIPNPDFDFGELEFKKKM